LSRIEETVFRESGLIKIILPASIEVLGEECFYLCKSFSSVTFESSSRLSRIDKRAFYGTGFIEVILSASVEVLGKNCFAGCESLSSVTFEQKSRLL
jgi:hypothetical protein